MRGDDLRPLDGEARLALVAERLAAASVELPEDGIGWVRRFLASFVSRIAADHAYAGGQYDGRLALFRATDPEPFETLDESVDGPNAIDYATGWQQLSTVPVAVVDVPGSHSTMVEEPQIAALAGHLASLIAEVAPAPPHPTQHPEHHQGGDDPRMAERD